MVQHSKNLISTRVSDRLIDILSNLLAKKSKNDLKLILDILFTQAERIMIVKRVGIQYMLIKDIDRSIISEMLHVSSSTVAYYAIHLETQKDDLATFLRSILLSEKLKSELEDVVADFLIQPHLFGSHKKISSNYKAKRRKEELL